MSFPFTNRQETKDPCYNARALGDHATSQPTIDPQVTRASLLIRVRDPKDNLAWSQFAEIYMPLIFGYCAKRGIQQSDAADVAQEVMRSVASRIGEFDYDPKRGAFRGWLFTVIRSKLINFVNARGRREVASGRTSVAEMMAEHPDEQETTQWDQDCRQRLFDWAAQQARAEFHDSTWKAFRMTAVENKPAKEAAEATGLSVGAVYIAKSRVLSRIRELVASASDDDA